MVKTRISFSARHAKGGRRFSQKEGCQKDGFTMSMAFTGQISWQQ
jgi:hypothetical protein